MKERVTDTEAILGDLALAAGVLGRTHPSLLKLVRSTTSPLQRRVIGATEWPRSRASSFSSLEGSEMRRRDFNSGLIGIGGQKSWSSFRDVCVDLLSGSYRL